MDEPAVNSSRRRRPASTERKHLLKATEDGSLETLGRLLDAYRPFLLVAAKHRLRRFPKGKLRPSDVVQDTLRAAFVDFERFEPRGDHGLSGWLITLLDARVIDARRRLYAKKRDIRREQDFVSGDVNVAVQQPSRDREPPSAAVLQEERDRVVAALARLPAHYADVIRARHEHHKTFAQIGEDMGRSEEAVRKLWKRATLMFASELRRAHG